MFALDNRGRSAIQWAAEESEYGTVVFRAKEQVDTCQKSDVSCSTELIALLSRFVEESTLFRG